MFISYTLNPNLSHEGHFPRRVANEHYSGPGQANNDPGMPPQQQPNLATIPMANIPQVMRFSGARLQNATRGFARGTNSGPVQGLHDVYGPLAGLPCFANSSMMKASMVGMDAAAEMNLSQTDMYCQ